jgi:hypothetical protein
MVVLSYFKKKQDMYRRNIKYMRNILGLYSIIEPNILWNLYNIL